MVFKAKKIVRLRHYKVHVLLRSPITIFLSLKGFSNNYEIKHEAFNQKTEIMKTQKDDVLMISKEGDYKSILDIKEKESRNK